MKSDTDGPRPVGLAPNGNRGETDTISALRCEAGAVGSADPAALVPLFSTRRARTLFACIILLLVSFQAAYLARTANGLSRWDAYDEADAVRSAEAYAREGLTLHFGLPRILYGSRFPTNGAITDHLDTNGTVKPTFRVGFPEALTDRREWVYTHYPPGPNLLCGLLARCFGMERLWMWRLVPIALALTALTVLFNASAQVFGFDRGALIVAACAVLPMTSTYMPGLHYQGYTLTLLLLQISVLFQWFWGAEGRRSWHLPALSSLGFLQGWLSFDHFFIVAGAAAPLWLMRRAEGSAPPRRWLYLAVGLPCVGFGFAHFLHLLQVGAELGGLRAALAEFTSTAVDRAGLSPTDQSFSYPRSLMGVTLLYGRDFLRLYNPHFGPFMALAALGAIGVAALRVTRLVAVPMSQRPAVVIALAWPGPGRIWPALLAGFGVAAVWSVVMPAATIGNFHFWPRTFFFLYFVLAITVIRSLRVSREPGEDGSRPAQGDASAAGPTPRPSPRQRQT